MSQSIFIQNSAGIESSDDGVTNPNDVATGKVGLLGTGGEGFVGLDATEAPDKFQIVRGTAEAPARKSGIINFDDIERVSFEPYRAATQQVTTITPETGNEDTITLKITRIDQGFEKYPRATYEIEQEEGDTAAQIAQKFVDAINDARDKASSINSPELHVVTAEEDGGDLVLTAEEPSLHNTGTPEKKFYSFVTGLEGEGTDEWDVVATSSPDPGSGTYGLVYTYEGRAFGNFGFHYTEHYPQTPEHHADSGTNYDLLTLLVRNDSDDNINRSFRYHEYVIAVAEGQMDEETVIELFGGTFESPSPS